MLTPKDIENKVFKVSIKGYNVDEVDGFLQEICDSFVDMYIENKKNCEKIDRLSKAVSQYKSMEGTLSNALTVADKSSDEIEKEALRRAAEIIKNAEQSAEAIVLGAKQRTIEEEKHLKELKKEIEFYKSKTNDMLEAQRRILNGFSFAGKAAQAEQVTERLNLSDIDKTQDLPKVRKGDIGMYIPATV